MVLEPAAVGADPLFNPDEAALRSRHRFLLRSGLRWSGVVNSHQDGVRSNSERDGCLNGPGVLHNVGEGLLQDPVQRPSLLIGNNVW